MAQLQSIRRGVVGGGRKRKPYVDMYRPQFNAVVQEVTRKRAQKEADVQRAETRAYQDKVLAQGEAERVTQAEQAKKALGLSAAKTAGNLLINRGDIQSSLTKTAGKLPGMTGRVGIASTLGKGLTGAGIGTMGGLAAANLINTKDKKKKIGAGAAAGGLLGFLGGGGISGAIGGALGGGLGGLF